MSSLTHPLQHFSRNDYVWCSGQIGHSSAVYAIHDEVIPRQFSPAYWFQLCVLYSVASVVSWYPVWECGIQQSNQPYENNRLSFMLICLLSNKSAISILPLCLFIFSFRTMVCIIRLSPLQGFLSKVKDNTEELQWLDHLWNHENMFETGLVRANEC